MINRQNQININQYNDRSFPNLTIGQFASLQLQVPEETVAAVIFQSLPAEKQIQANKELIEKAMSFKVNASGAIILMVNTNVGLQLVYADSQRRKKVVCSNGSCEAGESMAETAIREFFEESGNPAEKGMLSAIVNHLENCHSLEVANKIGQSAEEIANRIIDTQADKNRLYINMSSLYVNSESINIRQLERELDELNGKLKLSAPYYQQAVLFIYGDRASGVKPADFKDPGVRAEACKLINRFIEHCQPNITVNFTDMFKLSFDDQTDIKTITEALSAIIDLTENKGMGLLSKPQLEELLSRDLSQKAILDEFKNQYFMPSFENIILHKGKKSAGDFLAGLEKLASMTNKITLGLQTPIAENAEQIENTNRLGY